MDLQDVFGPARGLLSKTYMAQASACAIQYGPSTQVLSEARAKGLLRRKGTECAGMLTASFSCTLNTLENHSLYHSVSLPSPNSRGRSHALRAHGYNSTNKCFRTCQRFSTGPLVSRGQILPLSQRGTQGDFTKPIKTVYLFCKHPKFTAYPLVATKNYSC